MKQTLLALILCLFILVSCTKEVNPFLISKQSIGLLNDSTQVKDLKTIFSNDSIVKYTSGDEFTGNINDIQVYEKGGNHLLTLTPTQALDSTATIKKIRVLDSRYLTSKGVNSISTFKDINDNYNVSSIDKTLRSLIVSVNEINSFFIISKDELPSEMWFNTDSKIDVLQVPGEAKINAFFMQWPEK